MADVLNKHFQFLRSAAEYASFDAAKTALSGKTLLAGEPALAYYAEDGKKKALLAIGGKESGQIYFYNSDKIEELIAAAKKSVDDRIDGLDLTAVGGTGKVITTVSQENGQLAATAIDLTADAVAYSGEGAILSATSNVEAALEALETKVLDNKNAELTYKTRQLTDEEVAALGDSNVKEAYKTVALNKEGVEQTFSGDVVKIYKDSAVKEIYLGSSADTINETTGVITKGEVTEANVALNYAYQKADGKYAMAHIPVSAFLREAEFKDGLQVVNGEVSVKKDADSEAFLSVSAAGVKISGVQDAIDAQGAASSAYTDAEIAKLDATVSAETTYSTVKVVEADGKLTSVQITNTLGALDATADTATAGYAEATNVKAYVDAKVSGKNVSATGDTFVTATAADNKVTIATQINELTVAKDGEADTTITGVSTTLVSGGEIASKVSSFVNARIGEEVAKLDVASNKVSGTNVDVTYKEVDGIVTIESIGESYATITLTAGDATTHAGANYVVKDGDAGKMVKASDLANLKSYADDIMAKEAYDRAQAILGLDVTDSAVVDEFVTSVSESDGKISVSRGKVAASGVTAVAIEAVAGEKVAVTGTTVAAQIESLAKSVAVAAEACNIDSENGAIVVTDGTSKDAHTKVKFTLSTAGATPDMLSIESDGLKISDTWDCGTF